MKKAWVALLIILFAQAAPAGLRAQEQGRKVAAGVEWQQGALLLEIRQPVDPRTLEPASRFQVERELERQLPVLFMESIVNVVFDSYRTVGDRIKEDRQLFQALSDRALSSGRKLRSSLTQELGEVRVEYSFPLYGPDGLIGALINHTRPYPIERILGFIPSRNFTGLVIYAKGNLPAHGKNTPEKVKPALFPKLYDQDMNLILSPEMCDPAYLRQWGMVAYTTSGESSSSLQRVGAAPLRTVARGVFGTNSTDILLPREAARKLLSREANHTMLRQGRILIIIEPAED